VSDSIFLVESLLERGASEVYVDLSLCY